VFSYQQDFDAPLLAASACYDNLVADAAGGKAAATNPGGSAWSLFVKAHTVRRSSCIADAVYAFLDGGYDFIHPG